MKAVIFDMDGVITDTNSLHATIESRILAKYGVSITADELTAQYAGVSDIEFWNTLLAGKNVDIETIIKQKWEETMLVADKSLRPIDGALDLIQQLKDEGYLLAIASGSRKEFIEYVVKKLNLETYFGALVSGNEVPNGKPAPDIFLRAAELMNVAPEYCVVIEDGIHGMHGAKQAGMRSVGLVTDTTKQYPVDLLVTSLKQLNTQKLKQLFS